jgi:hypothetical protein
MITKTTIKEINRGTPPWCIEKVLGDYKLLEAMQELLNTGVVSVD